jgi:hypothetical protein
MATRHEGVWRSEDTGPRILDLCTGRRTVVSFTPRPLCPRWKQLLGPIEQGGGGGPKGLSEGFGEKKNLLQLSGIEL